MASDSRTLCAICEAPAIGRNFDAYTCLSCKAFFRRNAYNNSLRSACRVRNLCEVTIVTRRHCATCRLNKCFQQGMKKELIRSLIAIHQASAAMLVRQPIQRLTTMDLVPFNDQSLLVFDDWNILTNIRNAYQSYCIEPFLASHERIPLSIATQPYRSRLKLQRLVDIKEKYFSVIRSFIQRILQYHTTGENPLDYIKENLTVLLTINTSELIKSNTLQRVPWENDQLLVESVFSEQFLERLEENYSTYRNFLPYDPLVVKLFLIILALTPRISPLRKKENYSLKHSQLFPMEILQIQNSYLTLLWKYMIYRFGYYDAIMYSVRFIQHFLRRQMIDADMTDIIENRDDHGQLARLLETVIMK